MEGGGNSERLGGNGNGASAIARRCLCGLDATLWLRLSPSSGSKRLRAAGSARCRAGPSRPRSKLIARAKISNSWSNRYSIARSRISCGNRLPQQGKRSRMRPHEAQRPAVGTSWGMPIRRHSWRAPAAQPERCPCPANVRASLSLFGLVHLRGQRRRPAARAQKRILRWGNLNPPRRLCRNRRSFRSWPTRLERRSLDLWCARAWRWSGCGSVHHSGEAGRGPFSAEAMQRFYGGLLEPLTLQDIVAEDEDTFRVRTGSAGPTGRRAMAARSCPSGTSTWGFLVESIRALTGC